MPNSRRETENYGYTCIREEIFRMEELMPKDQKSLDTLGK